MVNLICQVVFVLSRNEQETKSFLFRIFVLPCLGFRTFNYFYFIYTN